MSENGHDFILYDLLGWARCLRMVMILYYMTCWGGLDV